jgi:glycosyltransferase involved in cell wall biosynthesis
VAAYDKSERGIDHSPGAAAGADPPSGSNIRQRVMVINGRTRIIGVSIPDVTDWAEPLPAGKWSQFFSALAQQLELVDIVRPRLSTTERYLNMARFVRLKRAGWRSRAGFSLRHAGMLNAVLERDLVPRTGSYDLIVQLQTLCSPRSTSVSAPYVIYTDNTMALTQRIYPRFAPLPSGMLREWLAFESRVCQEAQTVFTFSEFARSSVIEDYSCSPDRVVAIGAGANQLLESVSRKDYTRPRALFVGRPFEPKGGKVLVEAWGLVRAQVPDAELILVGPKRNPVPNAEDGITWLGRLNRDDLAAQYRLASVFALPSMFDAWGHVFVEAMGHGLPCIGSDCCAMPEIIENGVSGLLVPRGEPEPLAHALIELLTDTDKAARMGRAGHQRVLETLTWTHVASRAVEHLTGRC